MSSPRPPTLPRSSDRGAGSSVAKVRWTRLAVADLLAARKHFDQVAPDAWYPLAKRLKAALAQVARHPKSGRVVLERRAQGYREVVVQPYRLVFAIAGSEIHVLRFWHSRRDPTEL